MADPASAHFMAHQSTRLLTGAHTTLESQQIKNRPPNSRDGGQAFWFIRSPPERGSQFNQFFAG